MTVWTAVRDTLLFLALAPFAYYLLAIFSAWQFFKKKAFASTSEPSGHAPPISILKPVRGLDREAYENYATFCRQDYPGYEIIFCVSEDSDPAVGVIDKLMHEFPERGIRLLIGADPLGASDKVNKLCRMAREARHDILIVSDSDVRVGSGFLRAMVAPLRDPRIGGVTCLYRGLTDASFAPDLEALGNSVDFAPSVLVAWLFGGKRLNFMLGAVMATTKKHLAEIGGFESLVDYFCDDYELGNRIAARGYGIELSTFAVDIVYPKETMARAFRHQVRWNLSIRCSRFWGHLGLLFTQGLVWSLAGISIARSWPAIFIFAAGYCLLRYEVALRVGARGLNDELASRRLWMLPLRDAFAFMVWLASLFPQRIHWRDRYFYVRNKRLVPIPSRRPWKTPGNRHVLF
jgi:ceramide glucosyltransferase